MANRRVIPEVQGLFDKYNHNAGVGRRLSRTDALDLLSAEFGLDAPDSEKMFEHFDKDKNGALSLWEFQHFYNVAGNRSPEIVSEFQRCDKEGRGYLTLDEVEEVIRTAPTRNGELLDEKEVQMFLKATGTEGKVSFGEFVDLFAKLKMYRKS